MRRFIEGLDVLVRTAVFHVVDLETLRCVGGRGEETVPSMARSGSSL
jgi:hypothetical protein